MAYIPLIVASLAVGTTGTGAALIFSSGLRFELEPRYLPLKDDQNFNSSIDYNNPGYIAFGRKYKWYMVGQSRFNRRWWTRSLKNINSDKNVGNAFKGLESGWWYWGDTSLNRVCREAYIRYAKDIDHNTQDSEEGAVGPHRKFREEDVWKYCSFLHRKPSTIGNAESYASGTIGADGTAKTKLISTTDPENDLFWEIRNREFFEEIGTDLVVGDSEEDFFEDLFEQNGGIMTKTIRERCEEAYSKAAATKSQKDAPTMADTLKYCSLE